MHNNRKRVLINIVIVLKISKIKLECNSIPGTIG